MAAPVTSTISRLSLLTVIASIASQQQTIVLSCTQQPDAVRTVGGYFFTRASSSAPSRSVHPCSG